MAKGREIGQLEEQAIGAARFGARALITFCAATLALVTANQRSVYEYAVAELDTLLQIDYQPWLLNIAMREDRHVREQVDNLRAIFAGYGLSLALTEGSFYFAGTDSRNSLWTVRGGTALEDVHANFLSVRKLVGSVAVVASLESALRRVLDERRTDLGPDNESVRLSMSRSNDYTELRFEWGLGQGYGQGFTVNVEMSDATGFELPINLMGEFQADPNTSVLVSNTGEFLPYTRALWGQVRRDSATEAREFLARRSVEQARSLEVLGVSVRERWVFWAAPMIVFALAVYLAIHVSYLRTRVASNNAMVAAFPWMPLMRNSAARIFAAATIVGLPFLTCVVTVRETWGSTTALERAISIAGWIVALSVIGWSFWALQTMGAKGEHD